MRGADVPPTCHPDGRASVHPHMRGADFNTRRANSAFRTVHPHMRGADTKKKSVVQRLFIKYNPSMSMTLLFGLPFIFITKPCSVGAE